MTAFLSHIFSLQNSYLQHTELYGIELTLMYLLILSTSFAAAFT